jgi:hypothetical protein
MNASEQSLPLLIMVGRNRVLSVSLIILQGCIEIYDIPLLPM